MISEDLLRQPENKFFRYALDFSVVILKLLKWSEKIFVSIAHNQ